MTTTEPKPKGRFKLILTVVFVVAALLFIVGFMWPMVRDILRGAGVL